jgi:predicted DNA-binding transcriptional regulator AlpA
MPPKPKQPERPLPVVLPDDDNAFVRKPIVLKVFPVGLTTWDAGVKSGRYPRGYQLGPRIRAWRAGDIRQLLATVARQPSR